MAEPTRVAMAPPTSIILGPRTLSPFNTVTAAIHHNACLYPNIVAAVDLTGTIRQEVTYAELELRASLLARQLREYGVQPGNKVPLVVKRGIDMLVGIYAILLCGAQYVPLDGDVVAEKTLETVILQCGKSLAVCVNSTKARFHNSENPLLRSCQLVMINSPVLHKGISDKLDAFADLATADAGCYVIYTSGTTGSPKGVDVTHSNVTNLVCLSPGNLGVGPGTKVGSLLSISFDMGAWEILACLCNGGTLIMRGSDWTAALSEIEVMICTPSILSRYEPIIFPNIKTVATAGERSWPALADKWASHGTYYNCCGPTETTIVNTMHKHVPGEKLTIGTPTPNNSVYILDNNMGLVPVGDVGIMWGGGSGISKGYVDLPDTTAAKYLRDPFANDGSMMYNTGDLGRWLPCGGIEILGRNDDQVKVKGFRVELDGISNAMDTAVGVQSSVALLISGEIHGFLHPETSNVEAVQAALKAILPYYARPTHYHVLKSFPLTSNGKVDKRALVAIAEQETTSLTLPRIPPHAYTIARPEKASTHPDQFYKTITPSEVSLSSGSETSDVTLSLEGVEGTEKAPKFYFDNNLPSKTRPKLIRNLTKIIFIPYRTLFSFVYLFNITALVTMWTVGFQRPWLSYMVGMNLNLAVLIRQDIFINILYTICTSIPRSWPLWMRASAAKVYHLGGVHSSAASCASIWLLAANINDAVCQTTGRGICTRQSTIFQLFSWMTSTLLIMMMVLALPKFRKAYHNTFECCHRFIGWTILVLFWLQVLISDYISAADIGMPYSSTAIRNPMFWMLAVATLSIVSPWFWLRRVPVVSEILSDHAIRLHFGYTVPKDGSFARISTRPLLEWHSFATIPAPQAHGRDEIYPKGYSLVVSNAGDWTNYCIQHPPTHMWVRGLPTYGVMGVATLFRRVVIVATGSGIGPCLAHLLRPTCPTALFWSTKDPERNFGKDIIKTINNYGPQAMIWDTKKQGRPDMTRITYNMVQGFQAEAVIVIANESITKKLVYGLETRGIPCYGAIWDS